MTSEIRPITEEELSAFLAVPDYVFANNESDEARSGRPVMVRPDWTLAGFVDGTLATSFAAWPFRVRLNGSVTRMAGVTMVGTYPQFRRRGILRDIMTAAFGVYRDQGRAFAILWASMAAIYQRFGYGLASTGCQYAIDPRYISFQWGDPASGRVRLQPVAQARPILEAVYNEFHSPRNLMIDRAPGLWERRLQSEDGRLHVGVYHDGRGTPRGYLVFALRSEPTLEIGPNQVLTVHDWVALDADAQRGLWEFCAAHDLVSRVVWTSVPDDDPLPLLLQEPRQLRRRTHDGVWMRITDVEAALPQRPYGDAGALSLRVHDPLCSWNSRTFVLETTGAESHVETTDVDTTASPPDLELGVHALAPLLAGHSSATTLARAGLLVARDDKALAAADRVFATHHRPWCPDGF